MEYSIRTAEPADAPDISRLMHMAGRGHVETSVYDLMVDGPPGPTDERISSLAGILLSRTRSWCHYSNYIVAEVEGSVASTLCMLGTYPGWRRRFAAALQEVGWTRGDLAEMSVRMQPFLRAEPAMEEGVWLIENVATFPEYRRRGLSNALLERALGAGREAGFETAQISVFIGNAPAFNAYRKIGFAVTERLYDVEFEKVFSSPGMMRMLLRF